MRTLPTRLPASIAAGIGILGLVAACGGGVSTGSSTPAGSQGNAVTSTVAVMTINGSPMLVSPTGAALYTNDQDTGGKPACVSKGCTAVWVPLTVPAGRQPTTAAGVGGKIGTVTLAGGKDQVTMNGKPLYTFALDGGPGQASGNGAQDSFDGKHFSWHSAVPAGAQAPTAPAGGGSNNLPGY